MRFMIIIFCLLIVGDCFGEDNIYSKAGKSGATFLKIGVDARASGMGEAYTGLAEGASSIYYNPAGLGMSKTKEVTFMHNSYFEDINHEFIAYIYPVKEKVFGIGVLGLFIDDIPRKTKVSFSDEGSFVSNDYSLILSFSQKIRENISGGVNLKAIHQRLDKEDGMGIGIDIGLLCKNYLKKGCNIGVVLQNIGPKMKLYKEEFPLPAILKVGMAYYLANGKLVLVGDLKKPYDNEISLHLGLEYRVLELIYLRAGYRYKTDRLKEEPLTDMTWGIGFAIKNLRFDYAFIPYNKLGDTHRISVSMRNF